MFTAVEPAFESVREQDHTKPYTRSILVTRGAKLDMCDRPRGAKEGLPESRRTFLRDNALTVTKLISLKRWKHNASNELSMFFLGAVVRENGGVGGK